MNRPHTGAKRSKGKSYFPALAALCLGLLWPTVAESQVGVLTYHNDNDRTGQNLNETLLTPANVNRFQFGKLFAHNVDSRVYAQPLYVPNVSIGGRTHNVVYVATEHNTVYAFDANSNSGANAFPLWSVNLGPSVQAEQPVAPEVGITGTPVIDATTGTLYVVSFTFEAGSYAYRLHALDWATGNEEFGGPVQVGASVPGTGTCSSRGTVFFDAANLFQRPGLLLSDGVVYIGWTDLSRGCANGWLIGYDAHTLAEVGAFNTTPNAKAGGIWQSGAAPAADASGNIYVETGDGTFDGLADFGDTLLKLKLSSALAVSDYFTPHNQDCMASNDLDLGSGAPVLLPDQPGAHPHLAVASDKLGTIYLVDRDNLGHYNTNCSTKCDPQIVQELFAVLGGGAQEPPCHGRGGEFGMPAYWNSTLYFLGPGLATTDSLKAFSLTNGLLSTAPNSESAMKFSFPGATPSISANGLMDGIVWLLDNSGYNGNPAVLYAYDATNLADLLYASNQVTGRDEPGIAVKFTVPTVANGKVYVAGKRQLAAYGPLTISVVPITLTFASQIVNTPSLAQTVQLTNNQTTDLSISSITATADYLHVNSCGSSLPPGANCRINVAFRPSVSGTINGALTIIDSVNSVNNSQIVNLTGTGTSPLTLSPLNLAFGAVQVGTTSHPMTITATNNLNKAVTLSIAMSGDYAEINTCGGSIAATGTCKITVTFTPTNTGSISGAVTITDSGMSTPQVVNLSGSGSGTVSSTVTLSPTSLEFSGQLVGTRSTVKTVTLVNTGSTTLNISNVTASGDYSQTNTCGNSVAPRGECTLSVTFTPEVVAGIIGALTIFDNANTTPQVVSLSGRGLSPAAISPGALTFAGQYVGTRSISQFITLTNNKTVSLSITSIAASRDYAQTNTCGTSLAGHGTTCEITVIFTPTKLGSVNGAVTIKDSASNSPQVVGLTGLGLGPVTVSPTRLTFPTQKVGSTSTPMEVTLTNNRMTALAVNTISTYGDFAETNPCGSSLAAHARCTVSVTFTPSTAGARSASLIITDGSVSSPEVVDLGGTGE